MRRTAWLWVAAALFGFQASDVTLRLAAVDAHFAAGATVQALPLLAAATTAVLIIRIRRRGGSSTGAGRERSASSRSAPSAGSTDGSRIRPLLRAFGSRIRPFPPDPGSRTRSFPSAPETRALPSSPAPGSREWTMAALYGALQFCAGNMLFYASVQLGGLTVASPSVQSQAVWAAVLGGLLLRERITRTMVAGIVLFAAGIVALTSFKSAGAGMAGEWGWAAAAGLAGGLAWAGASALQRACLQRGLPLPVLLAAGAWTGVALLNALVFAAFGADVWRTMDADTVRKLLAAGVFNAIAVGSLAQALRTIEISKVIPVISLNIVFNTINGWLWFDEYVNAGTTAGMLIAFLGVLLVQEPHRAFRAGPRPAAVEPARASSGPVSGGSDARR